VSQYSLINVRGAGQEKGISKGRVWFRAISLAGVKRLPDADEAAEKPVRTGVPQSKPPASGFFRNLSRMAV